MVLLGNAHFQVTREGAAGVVIRVTRTRERFATIAEMRGAFLEVAGAMDAFGRSQACLLVDMRNGPPRNDPEFERAFGPLRVQLVSGFRRVAVLVRTSFGRLQVERYARQDGVAVRAFVDEADAGAYLAGAQGRQR